jgi:hypothetical protein
MGPTPVAALLRLRRATALGVLAVLLLSSCAETATSTQAPPTDRSAEAAASSPVATPETVDEADRWFLRNVPRLRRLARDGTRFAGAIGDSVDSPRRLLRLAQEGSALADRFGDLAVEAPDPALGYILNDLAVAVRHIGEAVGDYARAELAFDIPGMATAIEEMSRGGEELRLAVQAFDSWSTH